MLIHANEKIFPPKYKKELANEMGLSLRTFQRRLESANIKIPRGLISHTCQVKIHKKLESHEMSQDGIG